MSRHNPHTHDLAHFLLMAFLRWLWPDNSPGKHRRR